MNRVKINKYKLKQLNQNIYIFIKIFNDIKKQNLSKI